MPERKILTGITADAFTSDTDLWALDKLKKIPLLPILIQKFYEHGMDRWMYCMNMSQSVRCGPKQHKTMYNIMRECSAILDMPEPELYVTCNPYPNAHTYGVERPYITLQSSIIDLLTEDQMYHLMGHELGHIKAGHVLYISVASVLWPLLEGLGRVTFGLGDVATVGLLLAYYEWFRQAEISADRAGLLVCQNLDDSIDVNLRLTGGKTRYADELSREAFMEQARAYQDANTFHDTMGKIVNFLFVTSLYTHPMPVHRVQQLERWVQSGAYDRILAGDYSRPSKTKTA
jgi:Zn-dependent protease with chaperone function